MVLKDTLKQLPQRPGVYMMYDSLGNIIYVGKAKNLKKRVSQYFTNQKDRAPKVVEMVRNISSINYLVTDTEFDALIEECHLIKKIKPMYNRQMKNHQKYVYLKISHELFPKISIEQNNDEDGSIYFGPFNSRHMVEAALEYLNENYPIRKCSKLAKKATGCLYRQLGTCMGACTGQVDPAIYKQHLEKIQRLLTGNDKEVLKELLKKIETAAEHLNFEKAAKYKEQYLGLKSVIGKQKLVQSSFINRNIIALEYVDSERVKIFLIKGNRVLYGKLFSILQKDIKELKSYLRQLINTVFGKEKGGKRRLSPLDIDEAQIVHWYLKKGSESTISFWIPQKRINDEAALEATISKIVKQLQSYLGKVDAEENLFS